MESMGSLYRPSTVGPDNRSTAVAASDSSARLKTGMGPLLYTSAAPAARMQIITRPLSGVPAETGTRFSQRERSRLFLATIISLAFIAFLSFTIVVGSTPPDLGLAISKDGVVTWLVPSGVGYDQGVRPHDVVLNDVTINGVRTVTVARGGDSAHPFNVTTRNITNLGGLQQWGLIILALIFIGVGGPVYVKARHRVAASAFYGFCLASAVCLVLSTINNLGHGWVVMTMFIGIMLWACSFAFFFFKFPVRVGKTRRKHRLFVSMIFVGAVAAISVYLWIFNFKPELYSVAQIVGLSYLALCVVLGLASLGRALVKERSPEVRQQMTIVLGGTALAVGPSLLLGVLPTLIGLPNIRVDLTALTLGIMPLSFAYAITQGQMLGVRNFIRRGVVYVLMGFSVLLAFAMVGGGVNAIVPRQWLDGEVWWIGFSLFVFLIALSYGYVQRFVERMVDKYIYHDAYDYKEALLHFSAQLAAEQNLPTLADELVLRTCRMMNLSCGVLLLATPPDKKENLQAEMLFNDAQLSDASGETIWGALHNSGHTMGAFAHRSGARGWGDTSDHNRNASESASESQAPLRVVPYARYGELADWLIDGLHYELSQLGIRLDEEDAPMQLIYFNQQHSEHEDTSRLRTQQLRDDSPTHDSLAPVAASLRNSARDSGVLSNYISGNLNGSPRSHTNGIGYNTANLTPTRKLDIESVRTFLGVPLWTRSRFVGVLCLGGKRTGERFTKDDLSLLSTLGSQAALAIYNAQLYEAREQALLDTIGALAHAIEAKDGYTIQHCENMTGRALALAQAMGLPHKDVENIRMGAILHDIGKIGIPDAVLNKPGRLTAEEYELMKQHAAIGARIVQSVGALQDVVPIVRYHQERYDGSGYPEGLKGEDIPIGARIIGVVDTYGAMTEDRVYRATPGHDKAIAELQNLAGKQFDPVVVDAFVRLLDERPDLAELRVRRI